MGKRVPNDREFWEEGAKNTYAFLYYFYMYVSLSQARWEYKNLPDTILQRLVELTLFKDGRILGFRDDAVGELAMRFTSQGSLDIWGEPYVRRAYAVNAQYQAERSSQDSVIIYNNLLKQSDFQKAVMFADRMANLDRAIDVNVNAQKTPVLILCNENQRLTLKNLYQQYSGNQPFIFADKSLDWKNSFQVLRTDAPYVADRLYTLKTEIFNEMLTQLGISNVNTVKKERMITDEVTRQLGGVMAQRQSAEIARQEGWDRFNKMFGTNVEVKFRDDVEYVANKMFEQQVVPGNNDTEGGDDDE